MAIQRESGARRIPPNSPIPAKRYGAPPLANSKRVGGFPSRSGGEPRTHNLVAVGSSPTRPTTISPVKRDHPYSVEMWIGGLANGFANDSELSRDAHQRTRTPWKITQTGRMRNESLSVSESQAEAFDPGLLFPECTYIPRMWA